MDLNKELPNLVKYFENLQSYLKSESNSLGMKTDDSEYITNFKSNIAVYKKESFSKIRIIDDIKNEILKSSRLLKYKDRLDDLNVNISILSTYLGSFSGFDTNKIRSLESTTEYKNAEGYLRNIINILKEIIIATK